MDGTARFSWANESERRWRDFKRDRESEKRQRGSNVSSTVPAPRRMVTSETAHWITHNSWLLSGVSGQGERTGEVNEGQRRSRSLGTPWVWCDSLREFAHSDWVISNMDLAHRVGIDWLGGGRMFLCHVSGCLGTGSPEERGVHSYLH